MHLRQLPAICQNPVSLTLNLLAIGGCSCQICLTKWAWWWYITTKKPPHFYVHKYFFWQLPFTVNKEWWVNSWLHWASSGILMDCHRADVVGSQKLCYFLVFITVVSGKIASVSKMTWKETVTVGWTWSFSSELLLGSSPQNLIKILFLLNIWITES